MIGFAKHGPLFQPMKNKAKSIMPRSHVFSRAWRRRHEFALNSDWLIVSFVSVVIGQRNCIGFVFTVAFTLIFTSVPALRLAFATCGLGEILY